MDNSSKSRPQPTGMRFTVEDHQRLFTPVNSYDSPYMTPGAWLAKKKGCTCPRLDNQNGYGNVYQTDFSEGVEFLVDPSCPVHNYLYEEEK